MEHLLCRGVNEIDFIDYSYGSTNSLPASRLVSIDFPNHNEKYDIMHLISYKFAMGLKHCLFAFSPFPCIRNV